MVRLSEISEHEDGSGSASMSMNVNQNLKPDNALRAARRLHLLNLHMNDVNGSNARSKTAFTSGSRSAPCTPTPFSPLPTVIELGHTNFGYTIETDGAKHGEDELEDETQSNESSSGSGSDSASLTKTQENLTRFLNIPTAERKFSMRQASRHDRSRRNCLKAIRAYLFQAQANNGTIRVDLFVQLFGTKDLLEKLFRLFDYHHEGKLNQDKWIEGLKTALCTGPGGGDDESSGTSSTGSGHNASSRREFVEVIESVAYAICGDSDVSFDQFCKIFKTKNVLNKFFQLIDKDLDGVVSAEQIMDFISQLSSARSGSRLTRENIAYLENLFRQYVGEDKEIKKEDFSKIIQTKNQFFTDRVFDIFDGDGSGSISLQEFLDATHKFAGENPEDKILFLFKVYDVDGDGLIQETELEQVMRACMEENGMRFSDEQIHELTKALFEDADVERRGALTYNALKAQLEKHGGLLENLSISIERWLVPPKPPTKTKVSLANKLRAMIPYEMSQRYFRNNYVYLLWLIGFYVANICLFVTRAVVFREGHPSATYYLVFARAAGQCLNFNCAFIVLCVLRHSLTFLRSHRASSFIPIDKHIYFHKKTGQLIFFFGMLHSVLHLINIEMGFVKDHRNPYHFTYADVLFTPKATEQLGLVSGCAMYTGLVLTLILLIMFICSLPFVRRGGSFEVFYWTHLLYIPFWILLILHAPHFWMWFLVPGILFIVEQVFRIFYWRIGKGRSYIKSGTLLSSKVTHLIIKRPANFDFNPGDYVFIRIPKIAKYEWHPFTISSGPEQEDALWLHVRAVGEWTNRLYSYFEEQSKLSEITVEKNSNAFFSIPAMNRRTVLKRRVEASYNTPHYHLERKISPVITINESTKRAQLKSVADSETTVTPESSCNSPAGSTERSGPDLSSSAEVLSNNNQAPIMQKDHKIPPSPGNQLEPWTRERLSSTNSMPDAHARNRERDRKMYFRQMFRSISRDDPNVNADAKSVSVSSPQNSFKIRMGSRKERRNELLNGTQSSVSALLSMRHKSNVISLKAPKSEDTEIKEELLKRSRKRSNSTPPGMFAGGRFRPVGVAKFQRGTLHGSIRETHETSFEDSSPSGGDVQDLKAIPLQSDLETTSASDSSNATSSSDQILEIFVDGPYGAPSSHIFRAQHAVLIGTGIGVTPFASILQSIMRRYWASRNTCPNCTFTWCSELPQSVLNLRKVDFFWINRDQRSFEWFVHLLSQLEIEQAELGGAMERFLDMHMYITSALQRTDMKAVGLQLALELLHEKEKRDLITGLKTRTIAGRPNWNKVFQQLKDQRKGKVTVFYCGPPQLARTLRRKCDEFDFEFRKELF